MNCFFVSDLHGKTDRYDKLYNQILNNQPDVVFIGGDILPHAFISLKHDKYGIIDDFINEFLFPFFIDLKLEMKNKFPEIFIILGNDDPKIEEEKIISGEEKGLWTYIHNKHIKFGKYSIFGYANVPPTPFQLKDWERYDVSRYVDPGCIHPTEGQRTVEEKTDIEYATIKEDLEILTKDIPMENAIFLFHTPPHKTNLDRAALDGQMIEYVPVDVHVGSIAVQRFIEDNQPLLTLHGHIHESSTITGYWQDQIGKTKMFSAAYEKSELAIVLFDLEDLSEVQRVLY